MAKARNLIEPRYVCATSTTVPTTVVSACATCKSNSNRQTNSTNPDKIIVGSFNGTLRVFKVDSGEQGASSNDNVDKQKFAPTDLLLEVDLKEPILQVRSGILLNSNNVQLAVLHPRRFCVYSISASSGIIEHGTSYNILLIYEHRFETSKAYNMCLGSFGQAKSGKDVVCIQDVGGTLNFYENESFSFAFAVDSGKDVDSSSSSSRSFPMEFVYLPVKDLLVMGTKLMSIECYRYQEIAMASLRASKTVGDESDKAALPMEWSYSFAETILEMHAVGLVDKWYVVVLGERNLLVLSETGTAWFVKKFDISPACAHAFANEARDGLITIVGTHIPNLLIYQNDILKWATNIAFIPVAIARANLAEMTGVLVLLSDEGQVLAGFLGTNPSLKMITMPSNAANIDGGNFEKANQELQQLKKLITSHNVEGNQHQAEENKFATFIDLQMSITGNEWLPTGGQVIDAMAEIVSLSFFRNVQLLFHSSDFYEVAPERQMVTNLNERHTFAVSIQFRSPYRMPLSRKVDAVIIFDVDDVLRTIRKSLKIPFGELVKLNTGTSAQPMSSKSYRYSIQVSLARPPEEKISLTGLFADFLSSPAPVTVISFIFQSDAHLKSTIKVVTPSVSFQVESNDLAALYLTIKEFTRRLRGKDDKQLAMVVNFPLIDMIATRINARIRQRNALKHYKQELARFSEHYRVILKRILVRLKDKNPTSLVNLERLLHVLQQKVNDQQSSKNNETNFSCAHRSTKVSKTLPWPPR